jgi:hypothetical protein
VVEIDVAWKARPPAERDPAAGLEEIGVKQFGLHDRHNFSEISIHPISSDAVQVRNLAIFDSTVERLAFNRSEVGGANLRALNVSDFRVSNSAFDTVDLTGSSFRTDPTEPTAPRSVVENAAFVDVETTRKVRDSSGNPDEATRRLEAGQSISSTTPTS